jgi:hypothetical protein
VGGWVGVGVGVGLGVGWGWGGLAAGVCVCDRVGEFACGHPSSGPVLVETRRDFDYETIGWGELVSPRTPFRVILGLNRQRRGERPKYTEARDHALHIN